MTRYEHVRFKNAVRCGSTLRESYSYMGHLIERNGDVVRLTDVASKKMADVPWANVVEAWPIEPFVSVAEHEGARCLAETIEAVTIPIFPPTAHVPLDNFGTLVRATGNLPTTGMASAESPPTHDTQQAPKKPGRPRKG